MKTFRSLIKKYTEELTKDLSMRKLTNLNHLDLNKEAIKLAQKELRGKQLFRAIKIFDCPIKVILLKRTNKLILKLYEKRRKL